MTLFLASVTDADEAELALAHAADIIDLKDPSKGSLGGLDLDQVQEISARIGRRRPLSVVVSDDAMRPEAIARKASAVAEIGADFVKIATFANPRRLDCIAAVEFLARSTKLVSVMFVDDGADFALVPAMARAGFAGVMLDTAHKDRGRLLSHTDISSLREFVRLCRSHDLIAGLAGSLESPDVPRLLLIQPDVLGFRSALCADQDRTARLDPRCVDVIRDLIPLDDRSTVEERPQSAVDYRLLSARGYSFDVTKDAPTDHVFVRDFVLPVRLGAYASEHEKPQRVRFNVDVRVLRAMHEPEDMRDVFSYDVITDGIQMIVSLGHVAFAETLAERIAALLLEHPRVVRATVRVEKLDLGPGAVGVTIERERTAETAEVHQLYPAAKRDPNAAE